MPERCGDAASQFSKLESERPKLGLAGHGLFPPLRGLRDGSLGRRRRHRRRRGFDGGQRLPDRRRWHDGCSLRSGRPALRGLFEVSARFVIFCTGTWTDREHSYSHAASSRMLRGRNPSLGMLTSLQR